MSRDNVKSLNSDNKFSPNLRKACEECHQRKIRCQVSDDSTSCNYCRSNNRICFFLPQNKSGRPKPSSAGGREKSAANVTALSAAISAAIESSNQLNSGLDSEVGSHSQQSQTFTFSRDNAQTIQPPASLTPHGLDQQDSLDPAQYFNFGMDFYQMSNMSSADNDSKIQTSEASEVNSDYQRMDVSRTSSNGNLHSSGTEWSVERQLATPSSFPHTPFNFYRTPHSLCPTPPIDSRCSTPDFSPSPKQDYSGILGLTVQLQQCYASVRSSTSMTYGTSPPSKKQLEPLLKIMDAACAVACHTLQQQDYSMLVMPQTTTNTDIWAQNFLQEDCINRSLIALIIALLLKVLDICDTLMEWSLPPNGYGNLETLLIIKKLELTGIQIRIALSGVRKIDQGFEPIIGDAKRRIAHMQATFEKFKGAIMM